MTEDVDVVAGELSLTERAQTVCKILDLLAGRLINEFGSNGKIECFSDNNRRGITRLRTSAAKLLGPLPPLFEKPYKRLYDLLWDGAPVLVEDVRKGLDA